MPTTSKTARAALFTAAVGIGVLQLVQAGRHNRWKLTLQAAEMHQAWLSDLASNEPLREAWSPPGERLSSGDYALLVHCNRQVSLLSVKFRTGLLDRHTLRVQARWLMEREIGRTYWRECGAFREQEAKDRLDRVFNRILADEYVALSDADAGAA
ncbi:MULTISPECIES: DUF6082 family protein [unclassified Streptomyces]|uniref:DUF6082 family protein n=1 Tax=unclassified Streptomyces TaxID=2593676 RepID=UPI0036ED754B